MKGEILPAWKHIYTRSARDKWNVWNTHLNLWGRLYLRISYLVATALHVGAHRTALKQQNTCGNYGMLTWWQLWWHNTSSPLIIILLPQRGGQDLGWTGSLCSIRILTTFLWFPTASVWIGREPSRWSGSSGSNFKIYVLQEMVLFRCTWARGNQVYWKSTISCNASCRQQWVSPCL